MKRTDLDGFGESPGRFRKEEDEGFRGRRSLAWAKSAARAGSLGCDIDEVEWLGKPRNWDVRSSYCFRRDVAWSWRVLDALQIQISMEMLKWMRPELTGPRCRPNVSALVPPLQCLLVRPQEIWRCGHLGNWVRDSGISPVAVRAVIA